MKIDEVSKEIFLLMKFVDSTIESMKDSPEKKEVQAYNAGLRDALKYSKNTTKKKNNAYLERPLDTAVFFL